MTGSPAGPQSNQNVWVLPPISRNVPLYLFYTMMQKKAKWAKMWGVDTALNGRLRKKMSVYFKHGGSSLPLQKLFCDSPSKERPIFIFNKVLKHVSVPSVSSFFPLKKPNKMHGL